MRFTDNGIKALKPKAERYEVWESGRTGFGVRVSPKGRKTWIYMYRFGGKARRLTLGAYPALPLSKARIKVAAAKDALDHGNDPGAAALAEKRAEREAATVSDLIKEYLERSAKEKRSYGEIKRILDREVKPEWGRRKANSIRRRDVILLLDGIVDRGAPVMANRTLNWVRRMFNFGIPRDIVEVNPCVGIEAPGGAEAGRERVLTDQEIRDLWNGLTEADVTEATRLAIKLILVTAQRPGEVAGLVLPELDLDAKIWTLPAERTKNKRVHVVPLSSQALMLVGEAMDLKKAKQKAAKDAGKNETNNDLLFPARGAEGSMTSHALSRAFLRNRAVLGIPLPAETEKVTRQQLRQMTYAPHDLRRTASTRMTELGFTRFIADRVLNHTEPGIGRVYDRYEYLKEKRAALDAWGRRLDEILAGKKAACDNVVTMRTA